VQFRANLSTTTGSQTPYIDAYALKLLARPATVWGYTLTIKVGDKIQNLKGKTGYTPDGRALLAALEAARDATAPITLDTSLESDITVFCTALTRAGLDYDETGTPFEIIQISLTGA